MLDPLDPDWWLTTVLMVLVSLWAGFVSYLRTLVHGAPFRFLWFASHMSSSALAGLVAVLICDQYGMSLQWTGVVCALSGHMSAEAMKVFEDKLRKKVEALDV